MKKSVQVAVLTLVGSSPRTRRVFIWYLAATFLAASVIGAAECQPEIFATIDRRAGINLWLEPPRDVAVIGSTVFITTGSRFCVVDVSDPERSTVTDCLDVPGDGASLFTISGGFAYLSREFRVDVIDLQGRESPQIVGSVEVPGAWRIAVSGDLAYVTGGGSGFHVLDVENRERPTLLGSLDTLQVLGGSVRGVAVVSDSVAYVTDGQVLQVIDVADPSNPKRIRAIPIQPGSDIAVSDRVAYVAHVAGTGVSVIDIEDLERPRLINVIHSGVEFPRLAVEGGLAYVAGPTRREDDFSRLEVIDVGDPRHPAILGRVQTARGEATAVTVAGGVAYVASSSGVHLIDVSSCRSGEPRFLRGDCNDDSKVNLADALCGLNWLFSGGSTPSCIAALNTNGDASVNVADSVALLTFLFANGRPPGQPFPECGAGTLPVDDELGCQRLQAICQ